MIPMIIPKMYGMTTGTEPRLEFMMLLILFILVPPHIFN